MRQRKKEKSRQGTGVFAWKNGSLASRWPKMICCLWQHDMPCVARHDIQPLTRLYDMIFAFAIIIRAANIMRVSVYHDEVISFADRRISLRVVASRQLAKLPFAFFHKWDSWATHDFRPPTSDSYHPYASSFSSRSRSMRSVLRQAAHTAAMTETANSRKNPPSTASGFHTPVMKSSPPDSSGS